MAPEPVSPSEPSPTASTNTREASGCPWDLAAWHGLDGGEVPPSLPFPGVLAGAHALKGKCPVHRTHWLCRPCQVPKPRSGSPSVGLEGGEGGRRQARAQARLFLTAGDCRGLWELPCDGACLRLCKSWGQRTLCPLSFLRA